MKRRVEGFTVLELLLAAAMLAILLTLLGGLLHSTRQAYDANEKLSFEQQSVEAATELLRYEIGLAGYRGTDANYASRSFGGLPALELTPSRDEITVRFFEDRFQTEPVLRQISFKVKTDRKALVRKVSNGFQEAALGVTGFEVTEFVLRDGSLAGQLPGLDVLAGLTVRLSFENGSYRDISIPFQNSLVGEG